MNRTIAVLLMTILSLCKTACFAQGLWDTERINKDWDKIVNYVAVKYTIATIEANPKDAAFQAYEKNVKPQFSSVDLKVDIDNFQKELKENNWQITANDITDCIINWGKQNKGNITSLIGFTKGTQSVNSAIDKVRPEVKAYIQDKYELPLSNHFAEILDGEKRISNAQETLEICITMIGVLSLLAMVLFAAIQAILIYLLIKTRREVKELGERLHSLKTEEGMKGNNYYTQKQEKDSLKAAQRRSAAQDAATMRNEEREETGTSEEKPADIDTKEEEQTAQPQPTTAATSDTSATAKDSVTQNPNVKKITAKRKSDKTLEEDCSGKAIYIIEVNGDKGAFYPDPKIAKKAISQKDSYFGGLCEYSGTGSTIIVKREGECIKNGTTWEVTTKAVVVFQ